MAQGDRAYSIQKFRPILLLCVKGAKMQKDERDLLEVLKCELKFLEDGGYTHSPKNPMRPLNIFEDSPACMNYDTRGNRAPCSDCVLMHLVPLEMRSAKIPCRHIPVNSSGDTLDSLYRSSEQYEIEEKFGEWLRAAIEQLEAERTAAQQRPLRELPSDQETVKGTPLYQSLHPKCANPVCPMAFHWTGGGKFFRFRPEGHNTAGNNLMCDLARGIHGVRHYWLCGRCFHVFTLVYDETFGVVLKALSPEIPAAESCEQLSTA